MTAKDKRGMTRREEKIEVHEGRRTGVVVSVRLKPDEARLLEALSERDGRTMSETLRVGLHCLARMPRHDQSLGFYGELSAHTRGDWIDAELEAARS